MTKKDYILAARIIRQAPKRSQRILSTGFADLFAADNPRFDRTRWHRAVDDGLIQERPGAKEKPL